jgi:hypothetical protein
MELPDVLLGNFESLCDLLGQPLQGILKFPGVDSKIFYVDPVIALRIFTHCLVSTFSNGRENGLTSFDQTPVENWIAPTELSHFLLRKLL